MASYKRVVAQREALDKQIEETRLARSKVAIAQVRQLIADWQLSGEDCGFQIAVAVSDRKKAVRAAKYIVVRTAKRGRVGGRRTGW